MILFYLTLGLVYMCATDFIARLMIKDQLNEDRIRPMNFTRYHIWIILFWPYRVFQDIFDYIKSKC